MKKLFVFWSVILLFVSYRCWAYSDDLKIPQNSVTVEYKANSGNMKALVIFPKNKKMENLPMIFFMIPPNTSYKKFLYPLIVFSQKGYLVFCPEWKDHVDSENAFNKALSLPWVDNTSVGVVGVYEGATEGILLACKKRRIVKALASICGRPPKLPKGEPADILWAPTIVLHGEKDKFLPYSVSHFFYYSLIAKGRKAKYVLLPYTWHLFTYADWSQMINQIIDFFNPFVRGIPNDDVIPKEHSTPQ